jgi:hypothetical protein
MKPAQENNEKNEDYLALINQEYTLVVDGKPADRLIRLFRSYETDPFASRIEKVEGALEKYAHALLISGQYLDLTFLLQRYRPVGTQSKSNELLLKVGDAGKREDLRQLWEQTRLYLAQLPAKGNLGARIREAAIDSTISILGKYFLNLAVEELTKLTGVT